MKIILVTTIVCALQSPCLSYDELADGPVILSRAFPTNMKAPVHRNIQILNARKFVRARPLEIPNLSAQNLISSKGKDPYTVFPPIFMKKKTKESGFSESPYFQIDSFFDEKPNRIIKKTLPDYGILNVSRSKRSATIEHKRGNVTHIILKNLREKSIKDSTQQRKVTVSNKIGTNKVASRSQNSQKNKKSTLKKTLTKGLATGTKKKDLRSKIDTANNKNNKKGRIRVDKTKNSIRSTIRSKNVKKDNRAVTRNDLRNKNKQNIRAGYMRNHNRTKKKLRQRSQNRGNQKRKLRSRPGEKVKRSGSTKQHDRKVNVGRRLIAGKDAVIEEFPYVVSIQKNFEHWCAGALLNQRLVITTANCVWKSERVSRMVVRAGSRYSDRGGQVVGIKEMMRHPAWSIRRNPDHDVALLLLDNNIRFSHSVHGVDLPNHAMMPAFDDVWVTSWGSDRRDGIYENRELSLQSYHARLIDHEKCNNITQRFGVSVTHDFICLSQTGKRAPCTRDTGAPAVSDGVLWGLASWGIRKLCGTERFPAMFSYIASDSNMNFITNATHLLMADERFYPFPDRYREVKYEQTESTTETKTTPKLRVVKF